MAIEITSEQVKEVRVALGLTQVEFAKEVGVSQPLVAMWEGGDRDPSGPAAIVLSQLKEKADKKISKKSRHRS